VSPLYRFVQRHATQYAVTTLCRVLEVSKAGYYAWGKRAPSARTQTDAALVPAIRAVHAASGRTYGSPRVQRELRAQGQRHGVKRVARVMRTAGLRGAIARRFRVTTTQSAHAEPVAPNVLARRFAPEYQTPDRVWVGDITYVPTRQGFVYLAVVLDLASRRVVGWAMRHTLEQQLALDALTMALQQRRPAPGLVHHTDRGVQYAARAYRAQLAAHGLQPSMSRPGNCWDNAVAESFFATLKRELVDGADFPTRDAARTAIFRYVEGWYNPRRRHSALGYRSPVEFERQQQHTAA
jgi:transposase InsO family protein